MAFSNVTQILVCPPVRHTARPVIREHGVTVHADEIILRARAYAAALADLGVQEGSRVAVLTEKSSEGLAAFFGVWLARAVLVPVYTVLKTRQLLHILNDSESVVLIASPEKTEGLGVNEGSSLKFLAPADVKNDGASVSTDVARPDDSDRLAAILYTSGSTGLAKGVALSHENILAGTRIVSNYLKLNKFDRILSVLPWSFDAGLNQVLTALWSGGTLVIPNSILVGDILSALRDERITGLAAIPTIWLQLAGERSSFLKESFPHLRYITNTGGSLPESVIKSMHGHLKSTEIFLMYGLTEAFRSTYLPPDQLSKRPTSIGRAINETEILVINEKNEVCGPGEVGQLVHAGPTVALGYWKNPEATAERYRSHPLKPSGNRHVVYSGDLVKMDDEGYLYFIGRNDEMLKNQGHRISPTELENLVYESGLVTAIVAKTRPSRNGETELVFHCVPRSAERFDAEELLRYCRREMPVFMLPKAVIAHAFFPLTSSGKIDRRAL